MIRTYTELIKLPTFEERFEYLKLNSSIGAITFGFDRYANQIFYSSNAWKEIRRKVILRDSNDMGVLDLGHPDYQISGKVMVHHMNPIKIEDIIDKKDYILDPEFLICVSKETHNAIHYGDSNLLPRYTFIVRTPNDTCPWRKED
jgi:hypothetical protein